jgi:hypothetical protein
MEVGKEQQAQARRKLAALYLLHGGQLSQSPHKRRTAHYPTDCGQLSTRRISRWRSNAEAMLASARLGTFGHCARQASSNGLA